MVSSVRYTFFLNYINHIYVHLSLSFAFTQLLAAKKDSVYLSFTSKHMIYVKRMNNHYYISTADNLEINRFQEYKLYNIWFIRFVCCNPLLQSQKNFKGKSLKRNNRAAIFFLRWKKYDRCFWWGSIKHVVHLTRVSFEELVSLNVKHKLLKMHCISRKCSTFTFSKLDMKVDLSLMWPLKFQTS